MLYTAVEALAHATEEASEPLRTGIGQTVQNVTVMLELKKVESKKRNGWIYLPRKTSTKVAGPNVVGPILRFVSKGNYSFVNPRG